MRQIHVGEFRIGEKERNTINAVLDSGRVSEGEYVREFEDNFAEYIGTKHCIAVNSGSSALLVGLDALRIDREFYTNKAITTPLTYIATTNAIVKARLDPDFVDVDPYTFGIDTGSLSETLADINSEIYDVLVLVHLMGYPCEMKIIESIAKEYSLHVVEDAAQAHGTVYDNQKCGSFGIFSIFSFYIAHNIQAGEMGAVCTNDSDIAEKVRQLKANGRSCKCKVCTRYTGGCAVKEKTGIDPRFNHEFVGYNFKTTEFTAALANLQLSRADEIKKKRLENVKYLNDELKFLEPNIRLPLYNENVSYLAYPMVIEGKFKRKQLLNELEHCGVENCPLFGCIPLQQPAYEMYKSDYENKLKNARHIGKKGFYIGCHQYLSDDDLEYVVKVFKKLDGTKVE
ncbi:MAG: DegT/DnrJ/EryC1/StrS family aminotransferase [Gammaproteobacteria bacterium]|nr:DegT/DnrJ/EryC1/StrS family aminotransferase [Gammaproteobacteria bacterium]